MIWGSTGQFYNPKVSFDNKKIVQTHLSGLHVDLIVNVNFGLISRLLRLINKWSFTVSTYYTELYMILYYSEDSIVNKNKHILNDD